MKTNKIESFKIFLIIPIVLLFIFPIFAIGGPLVGIQYLTWFNYSQNPMGCEGEGWREHPFGLHEVRSLAFTPDERGFCYSSQDVETAKVHARLFKDLGINFVVFDESNFSKTVSPRNNPTFLAAKKAMLGFRSYTDYKIRVTFQLSLTCWGESCHNKVNDRVERFTYNNYVKEHIEEIAQLVVLNPDDFVKINGKPLLLFYISQGSNVYTLDNNLAFGGPGRIIPTIEEFNPNILVEGKKHFLSDFFSVRFAVVAADSFDYSTFSEKIWPFQCDSNTCLFKEVGYLSVANHTTNSRSMDTFKNYFDSARGKDILLIRSWNEFSSTDENRQKAYTLEPNTQLHKYDRYSGPDPWFFFNAIKDTLRTLH